jgi:hypothetical protein
VSIAARSAGDDLLHGSLYRRARRAVIRSIHAADDTIARIGRSRARVLFEAASPLSLAVFRPVFERLRHDPRLEFWFMTADNAWDADGTFRAAGITENIVSVRDARWMKFDLYINTDFWNTTWLRRRVPRIHMFHGVAGKYGLDAPVRIAPVVASFDRLLFPNRDRLDRYAEARLIDPDGKQGQLVGYPKVDCLVDGSLDRLAIQRSLGLEPSLPTVLYAPTWSPYSSLDRIGVEVIEALGGLGVNVIVKLHDRTFDRARGSAGTDWRARLDALSCRGRVHLAQDANASPYLFASDALVTDHSSVGFEFMLLDRPIVVIDCPELIDKARISRHKVGLLRSAADIATDAATVASTVMNALASPDRHSVPRRAIARNLFHEAGGATTRAVESIYELLSLSPVGAARMAESAAEPSGTDIAPTFSSYEARDSYRA